ncbi:hypothetical protein LOTGIDRAFT_173663 [Lottia gigantea]|uniref:Uncharacterized protein n=1 Tax=Lottia gigantea TaxID=225164 RepID=V4A6N9_LOTGI|nr:hypothetical protein LOTGIDRAFT_173663 [Lottia gigantea]ESO99598.1 hypothetical protein LOTGIDRAFT_173663 [Lottia gigantea]
MESPAETTEEPSAEPPAEVVQHTSPEPVPDTIDDEQNRPEDEDQLRPSRTRQAPQWIQRGEYVLTQQIPRFQRLADLARSLLPVDFATLAPERLRIVLEMLPTLCKSIFPEEFL